MHNGINADVVAPDHGYSTQVINM